jgi:hypothetical protein
MHWHLNLQHLDKINTLSRMTPSPMYITQPFIIETPPAMLLLAFYCQSISLDVASKIKSSKTTPLATTTSWYVMLLFGVSMDHKMVPLFASIATHPPSFVTSFDGRNVKLLLWKLIMFV